MCSPARRLGSGWPSGEASAFPSPLKLKCRLFGGEGVRLGAGRAPWWGKERGVLSPREGCGSRARRHTERLA